MAQGRVQVQEFGGNASLRPAPMQSDTYAAPARPAQDNKLAQLAQALGSFSTSIGQFSQTFTPTEEERQRAAWAAERKIEGMTLPENRAAVETGALPVYEDKFAQRAVMAASGLKYGQEQAEALKQDMMTNFDWNTGDPDQYLTQKINETLANSPYAEDPNFGRQAVAQMSTVRHWAFQFGEERKTTEFVDKQHQAAFDYMDSFVRSQAKGGVDPTRIADTLRAQYADFGKAGTLGMNTEAVDKEVLNVARGIAAEYPEVALGLINHTYKGRDGADRSFLSDLNTRETATQIEAMAHKALSAKAGATWETKLRNQDYELLRSGNGDQISDAAHFTEPDGTERTLSKEDRRKAASAEYLRLSAEEAKGNREGQSMQLARELRQFRLSGLKHPTLEAKLTGIADMASPDMLGDPEAKAKLMDKLKAYRWMQQESNGSIMAYTKPEDRDFAEAFFMARDLDQQSDDAVLISTEK